VKRNSKKALLDEGRKEAAGVGRRTRMKLNGTKFIDKVFYRGGLHTDEQEPVRPRRRNRADNVRQCNSDSWEPTTQKKAGGKRELVRRKRPFRRGKIQGNAILRR